jgi:hypothetical protein
MWTMIPSLDVLVQSLAVAFTQPSFQAQCQILLGWLMCLGSHSEYRVFETAQAEHEVSRAQRHPFDRFYNFFSRSSWSVNDLAYRVALAIVLRLQPQGVLNLVVDDTLLHKRGLHVWGLGWFRDAVASTKKRVATASGNNWVVLGLAIPVPFCSTHILCLPLLARQHLPGKDQPSCVALAKEMLLEVLAWFPDRRFTLAGDGAYAAEGLLMDLDDRVTFVGRMRGDAEVYDPTPVLRKGKPGRKPKKGPRMPNPKAAAKRADENKSGQGPWLWQEVEVTVYGVKRKLQVLSYVVVWPKVRGLKPIRIVIVRDPEGKMKDAYLFSTDANASLAWVVEMFAKRWSIEVAFKASKQVMDIEGPQHWCRESISKLAPWVWLMQSVLQLWYLTAGHDLPEAAEERALMGKWDSEWSLRHMLQVFRRATLNATITAKSAHDPDPIHLLQALKNLILIAA